MFIFASAMCMESMQNTSTWHISLSVHSFTNSNN